MPLRREAPLTQLSTQGPKGSILLSQNGIKLLFFEGKMIILGKSGFVLCHSQFREPF